MPGNWKQIIAPRSIHDEHGLRERTLSTGFHHIRVGFSADPLKDDDWARRHALEYGGFDSATWQREQGINYKAYGGQRIWPMLSAKIHDAKIDFSELTLFRVIDQGIRHPTVCIWVAVNANGDRHVYREYYSTDRSIAMNCRAIALLTDDSEKIQQTFIDPSTRKRGSETLKTAIQVYEENGLYCTPADNAFIGYDAVRTAALSTVARYALRTGQLPNSLADLTPDQDQLLTLAQKPSLTFDLRFANRCFEECCNLRWQDTKGDMTQKAEREKPVDKDDDGPDCVRYSIQSPLYYCRLPSNTIKIGKIKKASELVTRKRKSKNGIFEKTTKRAYA